MKFYVHEMTPEEIKQKNEKRKKAGMIARLILFRIPFCILVIWSFALFCVNRPGGGLLLLAMAALPALIWYKFWNWFLDDLLR